MKLKEIIEEVDLMIPNSINVHNKIRWINDVQRQLYREISIPDKVSLLSALPGDKLFPLPDDCRQNRINWVVVGDIEYPYISLEEETIDRFWSIVEGQIYIYPEIKVTTTITINYKKAPVDFDDTMMEEEPEFFVDYHELYVLGCAARVAKTQQEFQLADQFTYQLEMLLRKAKSKITKPKRDKVVVTRRWL